MAGALNRLQKMIVLEIQYFEDVNDSPPELPPEQQSYLMNYSIHTKLKENGRCMPTAKLHSLQRL